MITLSKRLFHMSKRSLALIDIENASKDDLVNEIQKLRSHVIQLRSIISKKTEVQEDASTNKRKKPIDFFKYKKRHIALRVIYFGWDYNGIAAQENSENTIESQLINALILTKLIESRDTCNYRISGRTDKGVSAYCQIISLNVRTRLVEGVGVFDHEGCDTSGRKDDKRQEIDFCDQLNHALPHDIKVIAWCPVPEEFNARFDCLKRTYKYFFPRGNLNVENMNIGLQYLIGLHDFRNLCTMNVRQGVVKFIRSIESAEISRVDNLTEEENEYDMLQLTITGKAFLYHQIRYIFGLTLLIGNGNEEPEIIRDLLDIEKYPTRPQYAISEALPLILYDCEYENLDWNYDKKTTLFMMKNLQKKWSETTIKSAMISTIIKDVSKVADSLKVSSPFNQTAWLNQNFNSTKKLENYQRCKSLEEKVKNGVECGILPKKNSSDDDDQGDHHNM